MKVLFFRAGVRHFGLSRSLDLGKDLVRLAVADFCLLAVVGYSGSPAAVDLAYFSAWKYTPIHVAPSTRAGT